MRNLFVFIIILISLYLGFGGFIILENKQKFDKAMALPEKKVKFGIITFRNKEQGEAGQELKLIQRVFPYAAEIPTVLGFMLTAMAFGVIGSMARVINTCIMDKKTIKEVQNLFLIIAQGMLIGVIILGISYTVPVVLTTEDTALKPITIVFLSLFGGINYENFFNWLTKIIQKKIFKDPDTEVQA